MLQVDGNLAFFNSHVNMRCQLWDAYHVLCGGIARFRHFDGLLDGKFPKCFQRKNK